MNIGEIVTVIIHGNTNTIDRKPKAIKLEHIKEHYSKWDANMGRVRRRKRCLDRWKKKTRKRD